MYRYFFSFIPLLCACQPNAETATGPSKITHEKKTISQVVKDEMSPLGHWEVKLEYPFLGGKNKDPILAEINNQISLLAHKYGCDENKGDKSFTASITFLNSSVVSVEYTDYWLCQGMPHPDGRIGGITYSLQTGKAISLSDEVSPNKKSDFSQKVATQLNKSLKERQEGNECGEVSTWTHFYLTNHGAKFIYTADTYAESHCTSETQISHEELREYLNSNSPLLAR